MYRSFAPQLTTGPYKPQIYSRRDSTQTTSPGPLHLSVPHCECNSELASPDYNARRTRRHFSERKQQNYVCNKGVRRSTEGCGDFENTQRDGEPTILRRQHCTKHAFSVSRFRRHALPRRAFRPSFVDFQPMSSFQRQTRSMNTPDTHKPDPSDCFVGAVRDLAVNRAAAG